MNTVWMREMTLREDHSVVWAIEVDGDFHNILFTLDVEVEDLCKIGLLQWPNIVRWILMLVKVYIEKKIQMSKVVRNQNKNKEKQLTASKIGAIVIREHISNIIDHLFGIIIQMNDSAFILDNRLSLTAILPWTAHHRALWSWWAGSGAHAAKLWSGNVNGLEHRWTHLLILKMWWLTSEDAHWNSTMLRSRWSRTEIRWRWLPDLRRKM